MAYTTAQQKVIDYDGYKMLVSASAGSGKTTVMVDRIIKLILEKKVTVDRLLAVTFTNLATANMKDKLSSVLAKSITDDNAEYVKSQLNLIPTASISTIHSFCANLLRTYFFKVGIEAGFKVIDASEDERLKDTAISELFEKLYEENNEDFIDLVKTYSRKRKDRNLRDIVKSVYSHVISEENPKDVFDKTLFYYSEDGREKIEKEFYAYYVKRIKSLMAGIEKMRNVFDADGMEKMTAFADEYVSRLNVVLTAKNLRELYGLSSTFVSPATPRTKTDDVYLTALKEDFSERRKDVAEYFSEIKRLVEEMLNVDTSASYSTSKKLFWLTGEFMTEFRTVKRRENSVDFDDLEHYALDILKDDEISKELSEKYQCVFADECQDVNGAQYAILKKVAGENLFMVGDVKQSIYAFRGCNPDIFGNLFSEELSKGGDTAVSLDENFRSSDGVLKTVNSVFSRIMTANDCGLDYARSPMLRGGLYPVGSGSAVVHVYNKEKNENEFIPDGVYDISKHVESIKNARPSKEGLVIADVIKDEVGKEYYDLKSEEYKRVSYRDIAILVRKNKEDTARIVDALIERGIPVTAESNESIVEYPEVKFLIDVLSLIDRFDKDVPLVSALKSSIGKLDENELMSIRKAYPTEETFYLSAKKYAEEKDDGISEKLKKFYAYMDRIRLLAEYESAGEILTRIVRENSIDVELLSTPFGAEKLRRVNRFILEAQGEDGKTGVRKFLNKLEYIKKNITDGAVSGGDTVKVLTMHNSKGLEFPVVILASTDALFNQEDVKKEVYFERSTGIAVRDYDQTTRVIKKETPFRFLVGCKIKERNVLEEMRIFYVALTRAKYRLHVVTAKMPSAGTRGLQSKSFADFLSLSDAEVVEYTENPTQEEYLNKELTPRDILVGSCDQKLSDKIRDYITFDYKYRSDVTLPMKRSVSALVVKSEDVFYETENLFGETNTETGNAYHKALQTVDFYGDYDDEWNKFIESSDVTDEYKRTVDKDKLKTVLGLDVFKLIDGYKLYKEQPFTASVPAKLVMDTDSGEKILIQGILDLLAVKDNQAIIVDYKYSSVKNIDDLIDRYDKQLKLYAYAVKNVLGLSVKAYVVNINNMNFKEIKNLDL